MALRAALKAHTQTASDYRTLRDPCNMIGLYALACSKQRGGSPTRALKNQRMALQYGIFLLPLVLKTKQNETKRNETEYVIKWNETERHDCRNWQTNGTLITVSRNETERFWKRFFDTYCMYRTTQMTYKSKLIKSQPTNYIPGKTLSSQHFAAGCNR